tara:strand:- start:18614 stop:18826 length:213 start_codon:yes stop_codon:yes gene_type:complete
MVLLSSHPHSLPSYNSNRYIYVNNKKKIILKRGKGEVRGARRMTNDEQSAKQKKQRVGGTEGIPPQGVRA